MKIINNRNFWYGVGAFVLYWTAAYFLDFWTLHEVVSSLVIGLSAAVIILFGREAWTALKYDTPDRAYQLVLGIVIAWAAVLINRMYHLWWRGSGQRIEDINTDMITFFSFCLVMAAVLHLTVPRAINGKIPRKQWAIFSTAIGVGIALAAYLIITEFGNETFSVETTTAVPAHRENRAPSSGDQWLPDRWLRRP